MYLYVLHVSVVHLAFGLARLACSYAVHLYVVSTGPARMYMLRGYVVGPAFGAGPAGLQLGGTPVSDTSRRPR